MSSEFSESQPYPQTFNSGIFSPLTTACQDGIHVDLNLSYTAYASPDMCRVLKMFVDSSDDDTRKLFDNMPGVHEMSGEIPGTHRMFTDSSQTYL
jgi:hypothetical protein